MKSYMYAPKDDAKHRRQWRDMFSPAELGTQRHTLDTCGMLFPYQGWHIIAWRLVILKYEEHSYYITCIANMIVWINFIAQS